MSLIKSKTDKASLIGYKKFESKVTYVVNMMECFNQIKSGKNKKHLCSVLILEKRNTCGHIKVITQKQAT